MKKIVILLVFALYLIPNQENNLLAQSDCYDDNINCEEWVYEGGPIPFRIPQFPECDIYVWYHTRTCGDVVQIWISKVFAELEEDVNCHGLRDFIYPNGYQGPINEGALATVWEEIYKQVSLKLFNDLAQGMTDAQKEQFLCSNEDYLTSHTPIFMMYVENFVSEMNQPQTK